MLELGVNGHFGARSGAKTWLGCANTVLIMVGNEIGAD